MEISMIRMQVAVDDELFDCVAPWWIALITEPKLQTGWLDTIADASLSLAKTENYNKSQ